jgi:molybdate transport system substrate-binding protein
MCSRFGKWPEPVHQRSIGDTVFEPSTKVQALQSRLVAFMAEHVVPNESRYYTEAETLGPWNVPGGRASSNATRSASSSPPSTAATFRGAEENMAISRVSTLPRSRARVRPSIAALALCAASFGALAADLTVSAAASLTNAFTEIGPAFEAANPGTKVQFNFGASGALLQQIAKGAPVDVFASADQETMNQAEQQQLVKPGTRANFVTNSLVVIVPQDASSAPKSLADLNSPAIKRIAIGVPASVPVGRYTKAVLEKASLWPAIEAKMIGAQSVRQALDYVARGEVDAGFVYRTDAAIMPGKVKVAFAVPTDTPVLYPIAPVAASANAAAAQKFVNFVISPAAQAVLAKYGFGKP